MRLRPAAVLYVHLHEAALQGTSGVARVEGLGPATLTSLTHLLAGARVTVKPVLDLSDRVRTTAYEHPESLKERVHLITGGDYWPYATSTSRKVDLDHPTPYDHGTDGRPPPPGQTGPHNSGPLRRSHHRTKTHGGLTTRVVGPGRHLWRTPHGQAFLVDHTGTTRLTAQQGEVMAEAMADGVELYLTEPLAYEPA